MGSGDFGGSGTDGGSDGVGGACVFSFGFSNPKSSSGAWSGASSSKSGEGKISLSKFLSSVGVGGGGVAGVAGVGGGAGGASGAGAGAGGVPGLGCSGMGGVGTLGVPPSSDGVMG